MNNLYQETTLESFTDYVKSFYGSGSNSLNYLDEYGGCTDQEIDRAISEYMFTLLNEPQNNYTWGSGDSVDRERVRDIIIKNKG